MDVEKSYSFLHLNGWGNGKEIGELLPAPSEMYDKLAYNVIYYHDNGCLNDIIDRLHKRIVHVPIPENVLGQRRNRGQLMR